MEKPNHGQHIVELYRCAAKDEKRYGRVAEFAQSVGRMKYTNPLSADLRADRGVGPHLDSELPPSVSTELLGSWLSREHEDRHAAMLRFHSLRARLSRRCPLCPLDPSG